MISVKTPLAFVIAIALAIVAYFISSATFAASFIAVLPSMFIIITVISLVIVSSLQNPTSKAPRVPKPSTASSVSPSSSTTPSSGSDDTATLYVGNLAYKANEQIVQEYFEKVGTVRSVRLVKDKRTGRRKGFGFIEISSGDENVFIEKLNESEFMERNIIVRPANEKQH
ncbi:MAG: RNA recognition motif-containing protein [Alphaproteobacteria bacterium]|jgi:RNA recognition motif-containing protein